MTTYYFDPEYSGTKTGTAPETPFNTPAELPSSYVMATGNAYLFSVDRTHNFNATLYGTTLAGRVTIGQYGNGANPVLTMYRKLDRAECLECTVAGNVATLGTGENLWLVPRQFFGLFDGPIWGVQTDITNAAGAGVVRPSAARQWCRVTYSAVANYAVIYSVGNPVDVYGGIFVSACSDANAGNDDRRGVIGGYSLTGGITIEGVDFAHSQHSVFVGPSQTNNANKIMQGLIYSDCNVRTCGAGVRMVGTSYGARIGMTGARIFDNYFEDIGTAAIYPQNMVMNDGRIYRNVVNGACYVNSNGGIYVSGCDATDGRNLQIYENSVSGVQAGNFWPSDGYGLYSESRSSCITWRRNVIWNCKRTININDCNRRNEWIQNVGIASVDSTDRFINLASGGLASDATRSLTLIGNMSVGYQRFVSGVLYTGTTLKVSANVALAGASPGAAIHVTGSAAGALPLTTVDGNSFYGFSTYIINSNGGADRSADATNKILTDPSVELTRVPTPTDPTVNYALQLSPNFWAGTVDLRPGTRVVA